MSGELQNRTLFQANSLNIQFSASERSRIRDLRLHIFNEQSSHWHFLQDPAFQNAVQARWTRLRAGAVANDRVKKIIAEAKKGIKDASMRNYKR